ncbi:MAG: altronate dehydratase, partial [Verrucomicrobia bacterium]|nr:altronate dehydratase [Verrucomicrobiota bacterium]
LEAGDLPGEVMAPPTSQGSPAHTDACLRSFTGYLRASGKVGTRNYVAVISSVNCSASVSKYVAGAFETQGLRNQFPNVDGVIALTHKSGCAMDPGQPQELLQRVLAGMAIHPNVGGYLLIGLGCEVNQISAMVRNHGLSSGAPDGEPPAMLNIQQLGGVRKTVEAGIEALRRLLPSVDRCRRTEQPISQLTLALNCGGSDGLSGCTANPALGHASDLLVQAGGSSVLAETPEIYGAEHLLARRAVSQAVADALLARVRWWEDHVKAHGTSIDNNPSFGNKQGGLTTIYEKSLGAIAKGGTSPLRDVYQYAEAIKSRGFCFMDTPGYDPVSMTGLVAGGCNIAVFTTGRGSAYGCKPTPCIKVASNTPLYRHQMEDMDINAGGIADGTSTVAEVGVEIFERIVATAGGQRTQSELSGLGDEEFAPWILGPTL